MTLTDIAKNLKEAGKNGKGRFSNYDAKPYV